MLATYHVFNLFYKRYNRTTNGTVRNVVDKFESIGLVNDRPKPICCRCPSREYAKVKEKKLQPTPFKISSDPRTKGKQLLTPACVNRMSSVAVVN